MPHGETRTSTFTVQTNCGTNRDFESRSEAERGRATHAELCEECDEADVRVVASAGGADVPDDATTATRGSGENAYTGHATARASEDRLGMADNLNEMAETRAMKRAVAWATGVGILAWEELSGYVDGGKPRRNDLTDTESVVEEGRAR